jgi:hypothetical protein
MKLPAHQKKQKALPAFAQCRGEPAAYAPNHCPSRQHALHRNCTHSM